MSRVQAVVRSRTGVAFAALLVAAAISAAAVAALLVGQGEASAVPADKGAAFGSNCEYASTAFADPIKQPSFAASHLHDFFGSTRSMTNQTSHADLRSGGTVCQRKAHNRSAYWLPKLSWVDRATGERTVLDPLKTDRYPQGQVDIYYKSSFRDEDRKRVRPFVGLHRMIGGDEGNPGSVEWGCRGTNDVQRGAPPETCRTRELDVTITFPQCWNNEDIDRVSRPQEGPYPMRDIDQGTKRCPQSHPYQTPMLTMSVNYLLPATADDRPGNVRVAHGRNDDGSLMWMGTNVMHADFMNGWDQDELKRLVEKCINNTPYDLPTGEQRPEDCQNPNKDDR